MTTPHQPITGSCLCGAVRFEITPPSTRFRYCHCSRCRKATGAAHAANIFLPESQFKWLSGESLLRRFDLPGAKRFAVNFCTQCGTRMPHKFTGTDNVLVPAGALDAPSDLRPEYSIFWGSKAAWYVAPVEMPKFEAFEQ